MRGRHVVTAGAVLWLRCVATSCNIMAAGGGAPLGGGGGWCVPPLAESETAVGAPRCGGVRRCVIRTAWICKHIKKWH